MKTANKRLQMTKMGKSSCQASANRRSLREISTSRIATNKAPFRTRKQIKTDPLPFQIRAIKEHRHTILTGFKCLVKIMEFRQTRITDKRAHERWDPKVLKQGSRVALRESWLPTGYNRVSLSLIIKSRVNQAWTPVIVTKSFCQVVLKLRFSKVKILQERTSFTNRTIYHPNQLVGNAQALADVNQKDFKVSKVLQVVSPITSKTKRQYSLWVQRQ